MNGKRATFLRELTGDIISEHKLDYKKVYKWLKKNYHVYKHQILSSKKNDKFVENFKGVYL
jgi:hypothetical protein